MFSPHLRYYGLKCLSVIGLFLVTFALPHIIPGPPFKLYEGRFSETEQRERLTALYGFDRPLAVQYSIWMQRLATGQWGLSRYYHRPVFNDILHATGFTLLHLIWTAVLYVVWTVALNLLSHVRRSRQTVPHQHRNLRWLEVIPSFFIALILYDVAVWELGWADLVSVPLFDPAYYRKPWLMVIPASVMALTPLIVWHTRSQRAPLGEHRRHWKRYLYPWRSFCLHFQPFLGGFLMELLLTEYVFTLPGLGSVGVNAIRRRDFPMLQGFLLGTGGLYLVMTMLLERRQPPAPAASRRLDTPPDRSGLRYMKWPLWGLCVLFALAVWAPSLAPHNATEIHIEDQLRLPNARYMLGTDFLGRDVLSRTLHGFRTSIPTVLLVSVSIALLSILLSGLARCLPPVLQKVCCSAPLLVGAFPPFLLVLMAFFVVERQLPSWSREATLFVAGIPVGFALFRDRVSIVRLVTNLATIGQLVLLLDVVFFYLRLSPEPITPTWGGDIRIGAQYSHVNIWSLLSPIIAVICSRVVLHQLGSYRTISRSQPLSRAIMWRRREADGGTIATGQ